MTEFKMMKIKSITKGIGKFIIQKFVYKQNVKKLDNVKKFKDFKI